MHLLQHTRRYHSPPAITGTLAYKRAQLNLQIQAQSQLPRLTVDGANFDNVWLKKWLGSFLRGDGVQDVMVQRQCEVMYRQFQQLECILTNRNVLLKWRLQHYVTGVLATALHNVGGWLLDPKTQRKLNGINSRLLARVTGRTVRSEAGEPTLCAVQWARVRRARWLGHILREDDLSLVKAAVIQSHQRGVVGTLIDEAPPFRSIAHLEAMASKKDGWWEQWCKSLDRTVCPTKYPGLARSSIRRSLRRGGRRPYDPVRPTVIVPPPTAHPEAAAAVVPSQDATLAQRWDAIFAEAEAEVAGRPIYDRDQPTVFWTDGSCRDNGMPFATAGWGVCVHNSDTLGEFYGALPGVLQTNNRAELAAVEAALQLAWNSQHRVCIIRADCNLACQAIDNVDEEWSWRHALGFSGWMRRWERNGWRTARGRRVSHTDIWQRILRWLRLFRDSPEREVSVTHVKAHVGVFGNERADELAKAGADLRFKLTERQTSAGWFQDALSDYWTNRRP